MVVARFESLLCLLPYRGVKIHLQRRINMKSYTINYYENGMFGELKEETIASDSKENAYFDFIEKHPTVYSAWVESVTYKNGKEHRFNTFSGKPY